MEMAKSFEYGKCQETWKRPIPLSTECSYKRLKRPNPLNTEIMTFVTNTQTAPIIYKSSLSFSISSSLLTEEGRAAMGDVIAAHYKSWMEGELSTIFNKIEMENKTLNQYY